ncbi:MAG: sugar O-acetyltransferase [Pseudomonadota bacterium]
MAETTPPYRPADSPGGAERRQAKLLCAAYNREDDTEQRGRILEQLLRKPNNAHFEPPFFCDYGYNIHVGAHCFANHNLVILDCAPVTLGDHVLIGPNTVITAATHPVDPVARAAGQFIAQPVTIGNHVWIGASVTILPGVTIGDNCTIGAGSVVSKSIPANSVALGNPCRVVRTL